VHGLRARLPPKKIKEAIFPPRKSPGLRAGLTCGAVSFFAGPSSGAPPVDYDERPLSGLAPCVPRVFSALGLRPVFVGFAAIFFFFFFLPQASFLSFRTTREQGHKTFLNQFRSSCSSAGSTGAIPSTGPRHRSPKTCTGQNKWRRGGILNPRPDPKNMARTGFFSENKTEPPPFSSKPLGHPLRAKRGWYRP